MKKIILLTGILLIALAATAYYSYKLHNKIDRLEAGKEDDYKVIIQSIYDIMNASIYVPKELGHDIIYISRSNDYSNISSLPDSLKPYKKYYMVCDIDDFMNDIDTLNNGNDTNTLTRLRKLAELGSVEKIGVYLFEYIDNENYGEKFLSYDELRKNSVSFSSLRPGFKINNGMYDEWVFIGSSVLELDTDYLNKNIRKPLILNDFIPVYKQTLNSEPKYYNWKSTLLNPDSVFCYSHAATVKECLETKNKNQRLFSFVFEPPQKKASYKLIVESRTNRAAYIYPEVYIPTDSVKIGSYKYSRKLIGKYLDYLYNKLKKYNLPHYNVLLGKYSSYYDYYRFYEGGYKAMDMAAKKSFEDLLNIRYYYWLSRFMFQSKDLTGRILPNMSGEYLEWDIKVDFRD